MWCIFLLLAGICVFQTIASTQEQYIRDYSTCKINPTYEYRHPTPGNNRCARSVKNQGCYHGTADIRRQKDFIEEPRYVRNTEHYDYEDDESEYETPSQQKRYSRPLYLKNIDYSGINKSLFSKKSSEEFEELPEEPKEESSKKIPSVRHFPKTKYCPHCRQPLPPEPISFHEPMDPKLFQQYQKNPHLYMAVYNHPQPSFEYNSSAEEAHLYSDGIKEESSKPKTQVPLHSGNKTLDQTPVQNVAQENKQAVISEDVYLVSKPNIVTAEQHSMMLLPGKPKVPEVPQAALGYEVPTGPVSHSMPSISATTESAEEEVHLGNKKPMRRHQ